MFDNKQAHVVNINVISILHNYVEYVHKILFGKGRQEFYIFAIKVNIEICKCIVSWMEQQFYSAYLNIIT